MAAKPRWGRPSFRQVLASVEAAWRDKRSAIVANGATLEAHLSNLAAPEAGGELRPADLDAAGENLLNILDPIHGGVGRAPKFPNAPIFRFFHNEFFRRDDGRFRLALRKLLTALSAGGIYDHLGGGFARYSTDAEWHVPHFEKMLYDNAQILELLALAHAETPSPIYAERAKDTFGWLMREIKVGDAFASSQDADQGGQEGQFYVWSEAEIDAVLGSASPVFKALYDVRRGGNWEGVNVLRRVTPLSDEAVEAQLGGCRARLFEARMLRPAPPLDDKILADWNGLMIAALARASFVFGAPQYLAAARAAFAYVSTHLRDATGRLVHSARGGVIGAPAMLDDYASLARAALQLFEATGEPAYLDEALSLAREAKTLFGDDNGGYYLTARDAADAPNVRARIAHDGALPSGVGLIAEVLVRLYHLTDGAEWREAAERLIRAFAGVSPQELANRPLLLLAADWLERGGCVLIDGPLDDPLALDVARVALRAPDPALSVFRLDRSLWPNGAPGGRPRLPKTPAAMICRGQACEPPVTTAAALQEALERH